MDELEFNDRARLAGVIIHELICAINKLIIVYVATYSVKLILVHLRHVNRLCRW